MPEQNKPAILSPSQRTLWHSIEPLIWTLDTDHRYEDPPLSILRTLLDQPRWLEAHHLYDEVGSQLFEQICKLPEYYPTRTENSILAEEAGHVIAAAPVECIVELGAGFSKKTMHLLREQVRQRRGGTFAPIDVSLTGLTASRDIIKRQFSQLKFQGLHSRYEEGISSIEKSIPTLFVFLGSTLGNFNRSEFIRFFHHLSQSMGPGDFLLLGADRVKEVKILEKAYNDSRGITAKFILNVFKNINRLSGSDFDLRKMRYYSCYNPEWQQMEMYAISTAAQEIHFPSLGTSLVWEKGERILVEISRKFEPARLQKQLRFFGLGPIRHYTDRKGWFSVLLFQKIDLPTESGEPDGKDPRERGGSMIAGRFSRIGLLVIVLLIFGCGGKEEQESKVKEAVEQAVTRELKMYESAKKSLKKIEKEAQEKREKALNQ